MFLNAFGTFQHSRLHVIHFRPWARKGHRAPPLGFYGIGIFRFLSMSN